VPLGFGGFVVLAAAWTASMPGGPQIRLTTVDDAAARAVAVQRSDLHHTTWWTGYFQRPSSNELHPNVCSGFHPDTSDLVVTGAETSTWSNTHTQLVALSSKVVMFKTARMAELDWQRTIAPSAAQPCEAQDLSQGIGQTFPGQLTSVKTMAAPRLGSQTAAFEAVYTLDSKPIKIPLTIWWIYARKNRTKIWLSETSPTADPGSDTIRLATLMINRVGK
jgi:hypothetical protein